MARLPFAACAAAALSAGLAFADQPPAPVVPADLVLAQSAAPLASPSVPPTDPAAPPAGSAPAVPKDVLAKVPPVKPFPRPGNFPNPPTGPGYYSFADVLTGTYRDAPPKYPYPRFGLWPQPQFDVDFRYLDDPKNTDTDFWDPLKRIRVGDDWLVSFGGQAWSRTEFEHNSRLTERDNTYTVSRARLHADVWYRDEVRVFVEGIAAFSSEQSLPKLPFDDTNADFLNLFVDVKAGQIAGKPVYVRAGRQELLYGSQRLLSPPDWANTKRTFDGVKAFVQGDKLDFDLFWVQPVIPRPNDLDSNDNNQNFVGAWATYKPKKGQTVDAYYLMLDTVNRVTQQGIRRGPATLHTVGGRYSGNENQFLFDFEGAMQLGTLDRQDVVAGFATAGVGYHLKETPLTPTVWLYYDYASGDDAPNQGTATTFNQLFPFGHYYFGWVDAVGRQNIHDINVQAYLYPAKWATVYLQYHKFYLASSRDALYGVAGNAYRRDATGRAGTDVGDEVDVAVNFHLTKHMDLLTGYSHLFGGRFLQATRGPNAAKDESFAFVQLGYRW